MVKTETPIRKPAAIVDIRLHRFIHYAAAAIIASTENDRE